MGDGTSEGGNGPGASGVRPDDGRAGVPGPVDGYLHRPGLVERCWPTNQRLTLLKAPGGFGKTTLLAACCRALAAEGVVTGWLCVDAADELAPFDARLAFAFERAGVDVLGARDPDDGLGGTDDRLTLVLRAVERLARPCVLALDELERLTDPAAVAVLNLLVRRAPPTLHLAMTCRELPIGLDVAGPVFGGAAAILSVEDLRFSKDEIASFFDRALSRRELGAVAAASAGWPMALRVRRSAGASGTEGRDRVVRDVVHSWVESRLWYDVADDDREFLLDVGLLDELDPELLDEALGGTDLMHRLDRLSGVAGLFEPVRGRGGRAWRLHPLIREHCAARRQRENPARYRAIHGRLAVALARRGEILAAVRHASAAADPELAGRIAADAGGVRLWLREGADRLLAVDRFLTAEVLAHHPGLAFVRVVADVLRGRLPEARRTFDAAVPDPAAVVGGAAGGAAVDRFLAWGTLASHGCAPLGAGQIRAVVAEAARIADLPDVDPTVRAAMDAGLCLVHNLKAEFDAALECGGRARRVLGTRSDYLTMMLDFQYGQIAMAQGLVRNAADWYGSGIRTARRYFLNDPRAVAIGEALLRELDLERNRLPSNTLSPVDDALLAGRVQFASTAAAVAAAAETALQVRGADAALAVLDRVSEGARQVALTSLVRYLAALRAALLAEAGRPGEAEEAWRDGGLPQSDAGCLDLAGQSWREMEALACARLRLHIVAGTYRLAAGRALAADLIAVAGARGLRRTQMRALALALGLEAVAGEPDAAAAHLGTYLELYAETDYVRPLAREPAAAALLVAAVDAGPAATGRAAAAALAAALGTGVADGVPRFTAREVEVLARLGTQPDREIAAVLGLTMHGVRYHIRRIFAKLEVGDRHAAAETAERLGLLRR